MSASSDRAAGRPRRLLEMVVLLLYVAGAAADFAAHIDHQRRLDCDWLAAPTLTVALSASLFWPLDLVAQDLLAR